MDAFVRCPDTGKNYTITLPTSVSEVARHWRKTISTACPHCDRQHLDGFSQLFQQSAIDIEVHPRIRVSAARAARWKLNRA